MVRIEVTSDAVIRLWGEIGNVVVVWRLGVCPFTGKFLKTIAPLRTVNFDGLWVYHLQEKQLMLLRYRDIRAIVRLEDDSEYFPDVKKFVWENPTTKVE